MSKGYPASTGTKAFEKWKLSNNYFWSTVKPTGPDDILTSLKFLQTNDTSAETESLLNQSVCFGRWERCKQVYDFNNELMECLLDTDTDKIPREILKRLPYPVQYLQFNYDWAKDQATQASGPISMLKGCFVALDTDEDNQTYLMLTPVVKGRSNKFEAWEVEAFFGFKISLDNEILIEDEIRGLVYRLCNELDDSFKDGDNQNRSENMLNMISTAIAQAVICCFYIISEEADVEVIYKPTTDVKHIKKQTKRNQEVVHAVGSHVGRRLGEARRHYEKQPNASKGSSHVRPHVRAGHMHSYWMGHRSYNEDGKQVGEYIAVRWIKPVFVGAGFDESETIHTSK